MIKIQKLLIEQLMANKITTTTFLNKYPFDLENDKNHFTKLLEQVYCQKNSDDLEDIFFLGFSFDLFTSDHVNTLCELIVEKWHYKHEDIARLLQKFKEPSSADYLQKAVLTKHDYLAYNDGEALITKCIWALGAINTDDAKEKLYSLYKSDNQLIRQAALYQLKKKSLA